MAFRTDVRKIIAQATNTTGNATAVDLNIDSLSAFDVYLTAITVSYQNPQTADKLLTLVNGATRLWQSFIPASARFVFPFPIQIDGDNVSTLTVSASASVIVQMEFYRA